MRRARRETDVALDELAGATAVFERRIVDVAGELLGGEVSADLLSKAIEDQAHVAECLWLIAVETKLIARAVGGVRDLVPPDAQDGRPSDLLGSLARASERVVALAGEALDPEDRRGLHHDLGGSG